MYKSHCGTLGGEEVDSGGREARRNVQWIDCFASCSAVMKMPSWDCDMTSRDNVATRS